MVISPKAYQQRPECDEEGENRTCQHQVDKQQLWLPNGSAPPQDSVDLAKLLQQRQQRSSAQDENGLLSESQKAGLLTQLKKLDEEDNKVKKPGGGLYMPSFGYDHDDSSPARSSRLDSSINSSTSSKSGRLG